MDISGNELRSSGGQILESCVPNVTNVTALNISDNSKSGLSRNLKVDSDFSRVDSAKRRVIFRAAFLKAALIISQRFL